jgi:hypothetical protein
VLIPVFRQKPAECAALFWKRGGIARQLEFSATGILGRDDMDPLTVVMVRAPPLYLSLRLYINRGGGESMSSGTFIKEGDGLNGS